ncbi:hypothetical protein FGO68_gene9992 [Halteria grandinella]|uniref:Uncharacterized protein n=1 Tax=Halteria grandinella TaxID=5974 RepID=A0A8J8T6B9_HALGN|nr:hypothetical protein FGO68_gene9992 [Halteria grandinella]
MKGYKERLSNTFNGALAKAKTTITNSSGNIIQYRHSQTEQSHFEVEDDLLDQPNSGAAIQDLRELILEEERKEILQSSLATSLPQNSVFDENSIDFSLLVGGTSASTQTSVIHTEVLIVQATNKRDSGMPLPMHCSWYNVSRKKDPSKDEFTLIEGIYGSCYQPSIEDLGDKICVHAIPASDAQEYQGMPIFAEVGPLLMNPKIQDKADFQVSLEKLNTVNYPLTKCSMKLSKTSLTFLKGTDELHTLQISEYQLIIVRASNNKIELRNGGSMMASVSMRNNIERDVLALVYRDMQSRIFIEKEENLIVENPIDVNPVDASPVEANPEDANLISNDSGLPAEQKEQQNDEQLLVVPKDDLDDEEAENMISENPFQFEDEKTVEVSPQQQDFTFPNPEPITEQINFDFQIPEQKCQNDETLHEKIKSLEHQLQSLELQLQEAHNQKVENENLKVIEIESLKKQLELQKEAREDQERLIGELKEQNKVLEGLDKERNECNSKLQSEIGFYKQEVGLLATEKEHLQQMLSDLEKVIIHTTETDTQTDDLEDFQSQLKELQDENERILGDNNYLRRKLQSVTVENDKLLRKQAHQSEDQDRLSQTSPLPKSLNLSSSSSGRINTSAVEPKKFITKPKPQVDKSDTSQEDSHMVDDFVNQLQESIIIKTTTDKLQALVEENTQMKLDLENLIVKYQQQEFLLDEYKSALERQVSQSAFYNQQIIMLNQAKQGLEKAQGIFSKSTKQENQAVEQMQRVMSNLTLMLGERDQEIVALQGMNRDLSQRLKEISLIDQGVVPIEAD